MAIEDGDLPEGQEPTTPTAPESKTPEYSEVQKQAMAQGWVPEDQYEGTGKWRDAEEFLDRGQFFVKIDEQNRRLKSQEMTIAELKKHVKSVRETEYKRALTALKAEKKEALDNQDNDRVVEIDDQIAQTRAEQAQIEQVEKDPAIDPPNPAVVAWANRNTWYQRDPIMKAAADAIASNAVQAGERNPTRVLETVEKEIKRRFPNEFTNPNRAKPGAVEGVGSRGGSAQDTFQLTAEETQVMNKFVKHKVMTKEEYIADIKAERALRGEV